MVTHVSWRSEPGRRPVNEDALALPTDVDSDTLERKGRLYIVADGMSPQGQGGLASTMAVRRVMTEYYRDPSLEVGASLERAVLTANAEVHQATQTDPRATGMATTLTAAVAHAGTVHVAHVGDSRAYLIRGGTVQRLTQDHSWVADQIRSGQLTHEQAHVHPERRLLTRSIGRDPQVVADCLQSQLLVGDTLVLCTDGLSDFVSDDEIVASVNSALPQNAVDRLVTLAIERGDDNVTVVTALTDEASPAVAVDTAGSPALVALALAAVTVVTAIIAAVLAVSVFLASQPAQPPAAGSLPAAAPAPAPTRTLGSVAAPSATPRRTPTAGPTSEPVPVGAPVFTPGAGYAAPALVGPANGDVFTELAQQVGLVWQPVGVLRPGEYYDVNVAYEESGVTREVHGRASTAGWDLGRENFKLADGGRYQWGVTVRDEGTGAALSPASETRYFFWREEPVRGPAVPPTPTFER